MELDERNDATHESKWQFWRSRDVHTGGVILVATHFERERDEHGELLPSIKYGLALRVSRELLMTVRQRKGVGAIKRLYAELKARLQDKVRAKPEPIPEFGAYCMHAYNDIFTDDEMQQIAEVARN